MKRFLLTLTLACFATGLIAQETEAPKSQAAIWKSAEEAYAVGDFDGAIREYQSLEKAGAVSSSLFYNLANAFYRKGSVGKAILYYERALKLDPADKDIRNNLDMARLQTLDKIDSVPQFILVEWVRNLRNKLSSNAWAIVSLIILALSVALLLLCKFGRSTSSRRLYFIIAMILLLFTIFSFLFSLSLARQATGNDTAVVVENIGSVKSSPAAGGNSIFVLHEGTKVKILESVEQWSKIEIQDGRQGWIKTSDIEVI
ncbi:MAG: tetratricopeptide repeat protein [Bacteroidales bacterium]|nr:tetratricopeptide repeat protein [Bacteroidales bacterium]